MSTPIISGSTSSINNFSVRKRKIVEVDIPWYQPRYNDDDENATEDEGDDEDEGDYDESDTEDEGDDDDYFYYPEEDEAGGEEGEESGGSESTKNKNKKGKGKARADWEEEDEEEEEQQEQQEQKKQKNKSILPQYIPDFEIIKRRGMREAQVQLDHIEDSSFVNIFTQFFNRAMLETIIENTNAYALLKGAGQGRPWTDLVRKELLVFLAILIYHGLYLKNSIEELWNRDSYGPKHDISEEMALQRFQQIKRYLHISKPQVNNNSEPQVNNSPYYAKVEPLLSHVRETSKKLYIPSVNVSVDEMMVRFSGRSVHTIRIRGKPTPEGYKVFALCDHGYTYTFLPSSRVKQNEEVKKVNGITYTGSVVLHLALQLPYKRNPFNLFMDNYFSSIPLYAWLRKENIGACGTIRPASKGFPKEFKLPRNPGLEWNFQSGKVVGDNKDVLAAIWMDNGPVTLLTTIHGIGEDWQVITNRKKPRKTILNSGHIEELFGDDGQKILEIPRMIDDYNHHMGGVDTADQLRSYNSTQLRARRNWMPLFFWLLDIALVNSFILARLKNQTKSPVAFRRRLLWELINMANGEEEIAIPIQPPRKKIRITKKSTADDLPAARLKNGKHFPLYNPQRKTCVWCNFKAKDKEDKRFSVFETYVSCDSCDVFLCSNSKRNCFRDFHTLDS
jgi:Transposase IS4